MTIKNIKATAAASRLSDVLQQYNRTDHIGEVVVLVLGLQLEAGGDAVVGGGLGDRLQVVRRVAQGHLVVGHREPGSNNTI